MKPLSIIVTICSLFLMTACSTLYQPSGFTGGYEDQPLGSNECVVSFSGNGYTSTMDAWLFTLTRAAELAKQYGYSKFYISQAGDITSYSQVTTPGHSTTTGTATGNYYNYGSSGYYSGQYSSTTTYTPPQTYNIKKPGFFAVVQFVNEDIDGHGRAFDADYVLQQGFARNEQLKKNNTTATILTVGGTILLIIISGSSS